MKKLRDLLLSSRDSLQEALAEAETLGDTGLYNEVDEALAGVETALSYLRDLFPE